MARTYCFQRKLIFKNKLLPIENCGTWYRHMLLPSFCKLFWLYGYEVKLSFSSFFFAARRLLVQTYFIFKEKTPKKKPSSEERDNISDSRSVTSVEMRCDDSSSSAASSVEMNLRSELTKLNKRQQQLSGMLTSTVVSNCKKISDVQKENKELTERAKLFEFGVTTTTSSTTTTSTTNDNNNDDDD